MKIEDLARITQKGFEDASQELSDFRSEVNERFDRLERIVFSEHKNRIERLEDRVDRLEVDYRELLSLKNR